MTPTPLDWHGQLSHIALGSDDVAAAAGFYKRVVGLTAHGTGTEGQERLGWGLGAPVLELHGGGSRLHHFGLEVVDSGELERLRSRIADAGIATDDLAEPGHPDGFSIEDPEGRLVEFHGPIDRPGERVAEVGWRPRRLQHITLATSSLETLLPFYNEVLGMRISDRMGDVFTWLRCGTEHHTIAIVASGTPLLLDHFSFDLNCWEDFKAWCDRLSELGVPVAWGPGRHGPGNNLFLMFDDADGYHVELSSEMERYFDDVAEYSQRQWAPETASVNLWGGVPSWRAPQVA
jgi:catechol-2,3-dioxygenase